MMMAVGGEIDVFVVSARAMGAVRLRRQRPAQHRGRDDILVHSVKEPLDDAKRDEAPHVDATQQDVMFSAPMLECHALPQRRVQMHKSGFIHTHLPASPSPFVSFGFVTSIGGATAATLALLQSSIRAHANIPHSFILGLFVLDEGAHFRCRRVHGSELENV
jgi:hypothetical protein